MLNGYTFCKNSISIIEKSLPRFKEIINFPIRVENYFLPRHTEEIDSIMM
jgi:hypothetical protein